MTRPMSWPWAGGPSYFPGIEIRHGWELGVQVKSSGLRLHAACPLTLPPHVP